jgi:ubiquinone/menaquinone biosynthesis C-methylase UbiE/uncharacterized protein YbaR (Trm112 family)
MRRECLPRLQCPIGCSDPLQLQEQEGTPERIETGTLACGGCGARYPIERGIPRMLPPDLSGTKAPDLALDPLEAERKLSEMRARDEQVAAYDRMWYLNWFGKLETPATLRRLDLQPRHDLLEAGCGTGRLTRQFASRCRSMVSVDFSWESLLVCSEKLRRTGVTNVDLVQADICRLPFRSETFDRAISCQVLEHIPTVASRAAAVQSIARTTTPGGTLVLSAYQYSALTRWFGPKEGEHAGGIYYYRFRRRELQELLSTAWSVQEITGALVYHFIARCRKESR